MPPRREPPSSGGGSLAQVGMGLKSCGVRLTPQGESRSPSCVMVGPARTQPFEDQLGNLAGVVPRHERPVGSARIAQQPHSSLIGCSATLLPIAGSTGENAVRPVGIAALRSRDDVVDRQRFCRLTTPAILTTELVPPTEVSPAEWDAQDWKSIVTRKQDHVWGQDRAKDRPHDPRAIGCLDLGPGREVVRLIGRWADGKRGAVVHHHERATDRSDVDGRPDAIQDEGPFRQNPVSLRCRGFHPARLVMLPAPAGGRRASRGRGL